MSTDREGRVYSHVQAPLLDQSNHVAAMVAAMLICYLSSLLVAACTLPLLHLFAVYLLFIPRLSIL